MRRGLWGGLLAAVVLGGCGDGRGQTTCGDGATLDPDTGTCVSATVDDSTPPMTTAIPPGGQIEPSQTVVLTADEPATIFYTLDGSQPTPSNGMSGSSPVVLSGLPLSASDVGVRYYAVDAAGNIEVTRLSTYTLDRAPGPVGDFSSLESGGNVSLTWTLPDDEDFASVVVARVQGPVASPTDGASYAVGESIGAGTAVIYTGSDTTFADVGQPIGFSQYAAWAVDASGRYSLISMTGSLVPLPTQSLTVQVDVDGSDVATGSITAQPASLSAAIDNENFDDLDVLTFRLTVTNTTTRPLYNLKLVVRSISSGVISNNDGTYDADEFYFIATAIPAGSEKQVTVTVTGLTAPASTTLTFDLVDHPLLIGGPTFDSDSGNGSALFDIGTGLQSAGASELSDVGLLLQPMFLPNGVGKASPTNTSPSYLFANSISLDGERLYLGSRQSSIVVALDVATQEVVAASAPLATTNGFASWPVLDRQRNVLYTLVTEGRHFTDASTAKKPTGVRRFFFVALNASTLAEVGRVELTSNLLGDPYAVARTLGMSSDFSLAAISIRAANDDASELHFVDAAAMRQIDVNAAVPGMQATPMPNLHSILFSADDRVIYAGGTGDVNDDIRVISARSYKLVSTIDVAGDDSGGTLLYRTPDGTVVVGGVTNWQGLQILNEATNTLTVLPNYADYFSAATVCPDGGLYGRGFSGGADLKEIDLTDGATIRTLSGSGGGKNHSIACTPY